MTYTVIGLYEDGQTFATHTEASDAWQAMAIEAKAALASGNVSLEILGAIEGTHELTPACDDSGMAAMAENMADLLEIRHQCQNCLKVWTEDQILTDIPDYDERVQGDEPEPSGECPECRCLCHEVAP